MVTMNFFWEKGGTKGSFTLSAISMDECIKYAEEHCSGIEGMIITNYFTV